MSNVTINENPWPRDFATPEPRTEAQIDAVLSALKEVWLRHPGMKLCQVVARIAEVDPRNPNLKLSYDATTVDDDEWVRKSKHYPYFPGFPYSR